MQIKKSRRNIMSDKDVDDFVGAAAKTIVIRTALGIGGLLLFGPAGAAAAALSIDEN